MPTEHDYERAADELRGHARLLDDQATRAPNAPSRAFVSPGPIADVVDERVRSAVRCVSRAADELRRLAGICDHRADVCRAHRMAVRRHEATPYEVRQHLAPPTPPASWVDL